MIVLDLFCGLGGFSQAFRDRGHTVIGLDIEPPADVIADATRLPFRDTFRPDVILASPPCTEFTKWDLPWRDGKPDMVLVNAALAAVERFKPRYWVLENVRGLARLWERPYSLRVGSRYLWGEFPLFLFGSHREAQGKWKLPPSKDRARLRSKIPRVISEGLCNVMEA